MINILCTTEELMIKDFPENFIVDMNPFGRKLTELEVDDLIQKNQPAGMIAGIEPLTRKVLERAKSLKVISRCGIGLDSVDLEAASELGIKVFNTPDAPTAAVAELALALMLGMLRDVSKMDKGIREGKWNRCMGALLSAKTVGIIGCGRIGTYTSKLLGAFGCNVVGYDPFIKEHSLITLHSLDRLLEISDVISLHIPITKGNRHIIGKQQIESIKPGAILINTARGGLIDEEALYAALKSGKLAGAALDCFENEPYTGPLTELDNVLLTAHVGSNAKEARIIMEQQSLDNLLKGLNELIK